MVALLGFLCLTTAAARAAEPAGGGHAADTSDQAEKSAAQLLPPSTALYVEVTRPKDAIALLLDHPLSKLIRQTPDFRKSMESEQFKQFLGAVGLVENRAGVKWRRALETITGGGVALGVDPATQGAVLLIHSEDAKTTESVRDALFSLARDDAKAKGQPDPITSKDYRGLSAYKAGDAWMAMLGQTLLVSNKVDAAKAVADQFLDGGKSLADESVFADARRLAAHGGAHDADHAAHAGRQAAWAFVRLDTLRQMGVAKELLNADAKSDNFAAELLAGGVLSVLRKSPYLAASLDLGEPGKSGAQTATLSLASPNDPAWTGTEKKFYFAPGGGGADEPLRPKGTVLSLTTWRDLAALFQSAPDLFNEGVAGQIAQADSGLSTFLGGKSFSADILGALEPQMQFVAARQDYKAEGVPEPAIRLPAMAAVFKIKPGKAKVVRKPFRLAFQSLVTFGNLDAASKSRPTLESNSETRGKAEILYATYETPDPADAADEKPAKGAGDKADDTSKADKPEKKADKADKTDKTDKPKDDTFYNFSPAMVISEDHLMLCSTKAIAEELADLVQAKAEADRHVTRAEANTRVEASGPLVAKLLRENREQLIAQNMLQKGHDRAAAEKEVDLLMSMVDCVKDSTLKLEQTPKVIRLEWGVNTSRD